VKWGVQGRSQLASAGEAASFIRLCSWKDADARGRHRSKDVRHAISENVPRPSTERKMHGTRWPRVFPWQIGGRRIYRGEKRECEVDRDGGEKSGRDNGGIEGGQRFCDWSGKSMAMKIAERSRESSMFRLKRRLRERFRDQWLAFQIGAFIARDFSLRHGNLGFQLSIFPMQISRRARASAHWVSHRAYRFRPMEQKFAHIVWPKESRD